MELIQSFSVDHTRIVPGIFTSRVDILGEHTVTTYDTERIITDNGQHFYDS